MIQMGKIWTLPVGFQEATLYINNVNSKPEMAHWAKAPGEPFKVCGSEKKKKSEDTAMASQTDPLPPKSN